jgi:hypothetical protein
MYYEDRLNGAGFARVLVAGATRGADGPGGADALRRSLEDRLGCRVEAFDLRQAASIGDRAPAGAGTLDTLAPLVGILLRGAAA